MDGKFRRWALILGSAASLAYAGDPAAPAPQAACGACTVSGTVADPTGAVIAGAKAAIHSAVTNYSQESVTDESGEFHFSNVPPNTYDVTVTAAGFAPQAKPVDVRGNVPVQMTFALVVAGSEQTVEVSASASLLENVPLAHQDVDESQLAKLPMFDPAAGLSDAITLSSGAVVADANGFFHPAGDHGQTTFMIDGQPVSDQQSKLFSTQLPEDAIQSMEMITGASDAQYGDKSSLVVNATTKSGLGATKPFGSVDAYGGSFGTYGEDATFGIGTEKFGSFTAINGTRTGRFLDSPEFYPIHDIGNNENIFERLDYQPSGTDSLHLNLFVARNWFQAPNSFDQLSQDQRQRVLTWNVAPSYQHTFNARTILSVNVYGRRDQVDYYGSRNPFNDTPVAVSQGRYLTNYGTRSSLSLVRGRHNISIGTELQQTRLDERFAMGVTSAVYNPVCLNGAANDAPLALPTVTNPAMCSTVNPAYLPNPGLLPGLVPFDLTRGGRYFNFYGRHNINQEAVYITDQINLGDWTVTAGFRDDQYNGLSSANGPQPRLGLSYQVKETGTVLRVSYARTFESPYNENLLLSSATGSGGLAENVFGAAAAVPIQPGFRNQFNGGFEQKFGRYLLLSGDYFWKYTHNAYDFAVLFNTPITFPIAWHNSKIDGFSARLSSVDIHGFQAYMTMGHARARFFPPEDGGLIALSGLPTGAFRIDHDQEFQQTTNLRYQRGKNGPWASFLWRFDSGEVNGAVTDIADALALTAAEQADIGFYCNGAFATRTQPITTCPSGGGATRVVIPKPGTYNQDTNPPRIAPRNTFDAALGTDNLLRTEGDNHMTLRFTVTNLTNKEALYNFLSTFSGTHFIEPRAYQVTLGYLF